MKFIFTLLIILISNFSFSQDLKSEMIDEVCLCFNEKLEFALSSYVDVLIECSVPARPEWNKVFEILDNIDPMEQGQILFDRLNKSLIESCDTYFNFWEFLRTESIIYLDDEAYQTKSDSLSNLLTLSPNNTNHLFALAQIEFSVSNYKTAQKILKKVVKKNKEDIDSITLLAWAYEKDGKLKKAIKNYSIAEQLPVRDKLDVNTYQLIILICELKMTKKKYVN